MMGNFFIGHGAMELPELHGPFQMLHIQWTTSTIGSSPIKIYFIPYDNLCIRSQKHPQITRHSKICLK